MKLFLCHQYMLSKGLYSSFFFVYLMKFHFIVFAYAPRSVFFSAVLRLVYGWAD